VATAGADGSKTCLDGTLRPDDQRGKKYVVSNTLERLEIGFSAAMLTATAIMVVVLVPAVVVWIGPRPPISDLPERQVRDPSPSQTPDTQNNISRAMLVRRLAFWTISVPFALALMAQIGFIVHQIALLEPKIGRPGAQAGLIRSNPFASVPRDAPELRRLCEHLRSLRLTANGAQQSAGVFRFEQTATSIPH
jgi:hypothetical protein